MDVCKEKYYGNTYRRPEHFGELPFVPRPFVVRVFHSVSEGQGGDAEIISAVNDKSLLIFIFLDLKDLTGCRVSLFPLKK